MINVGGKTLTKTGTYNYNDIMKKIAGTKLVIADEVIPFTFFDRKSDITIFCIHGINSSKTFIGDLEQYATQHNIFSYSYGHLKNLKIDNFVKLAHAIIERLFSHHKIIVVAHSFGSYIAMKLFNKHNIIKYVFINPVHPLTFNYRPFQTTLLLSQKKPHIFKKKQRNWNLKPNHRYLFRDVLEKRTKWYQVLSEMGQRSEELKQELTNIIKMREQSVFIRSSGDFIISSRLLAQFLNRYNIPSKVIRYPGHSPLMRDTKRTYQLFEISDH